METCKWVKHKDQGCYQADCGWYQGERVNPKQEFCPHCRRKIERITLNTVSKPMQELQEALGIKLY